VKILIAAHLFYPSVGGIETVTMQLAVEFANQGHEVIVTTPFPADRPDAFPFRVVRSPGWRRLWGLAARCDVFFSSNISLKLAWPAILLGRPWVIAHHTWIARTDGRLGWRDRLKLRLVRRASNIAVSRAIASHLGTDAAVIENPYDDGLFRDLGRPERSRDLVFLGRLVSDKGCDLLIEALGRLREEGLAPRLTIIGAGPERAALERQAVERGVSGQVEFAGVLVGEALVSSLNDHRILVAPSRWQEPFGLIALEGMACGCVVVGSGGGGLGDAIGPGGLTFPNGDVAALAAALTSVLASPALRAGFRAKAADHLALHRRGIVAKQYLKVLSEAARA
jgi:glycosyltransferase involved in cell wall biosynthesis